MRRFLQILCATLALGNLLVIPSYSAEDSLVWKRETVDADIDRLDLPMLLEKIASQTGWHIYLEPGAHAPVSVKFRQLPLSQALKALLGNLNFALLPQTNGPATLFVFETTLQEATQMIRPSEKTKRAGGGKAISNEVVITLKDGSKEKVGELARSLGGKVAARVTDAAAYRLQFDDEADAQKARDALRGNSQVLTIESNFNVERPTRTDALTLSSMNSQLKPKNLADDKSIIVGLIDTAVQRQGTLLNDILLPSISIAENGKLPSEYPTHGTSMSETVLHGFGLSPQGAESTNVRILPVDIYGNSPSTTTFEVAAGIVAAVRSGATIINLSLGSEGHSPFLQKVIQEAHKEGVIFVAAAGNEPTTGPVYPAAYSEVVAVTAGDRKGEIASYANRGSFVDVAGPGTSIIYYKDQAYLVSGTSAATAYVTGMAAGIAASSKKPLIDVEKQIRQVLAIKPVPKP